MHSDPEVNLCDILIDATVAALGATLVDVGIIDGEPGPDDMPRIYDEMRMREAIYEVNSWVSRCLNRPVVVIRPCSTFHTGMIGDAVSTLLYLLTNVSDDPV